MTDTPPHRRRIFTDLRPLRESADFRRLWFGQAVSQLGQQVAAVAIAYQVYVLTESSFAVGLVGLCALGPMVLGGLYGGALIDTFDRRTLALWTSVGLWLCSLALVAQAWAGAEAVGLLYTVVAVQSAMFAVNNPARQAIVPRLLPAHLLPAANTFTMASVNLGFSLGPLIGGFLIVWRGVELVYIVDAVTFTAAMYAAARLPPIRPSGSRGKIPGISSVVEGLAFLRRSEHVRTSFMMDLIAMVLAQPRALFPALALSVFAAGPSTLGLLQAAPAWGALLAFGLSGWISGVHRHGLAIALAVAGYGASVALADIPC